MISAINGYGSIYSQQALKNQYRLNQIMQDRASANAVSPVSSTKSVSRSLVNSVAYVKEYSSTMTDLMSSANSLKSSNQASAVNQLSASSSDSAVVDASAKFRLTDSASYEVNVRQLAAAQTNVSDSLAGKEAASADLNMQITASGRTADIQISATDSKGNQKTNDQLLSEAATEINRKGIGVVASVVSKDGKSSLQLQAQKTGESNSFQVSGDFAAEGGMGNVTQAAQNAQYSVTQNGREESRTSESNQIRLAYGSIEATLKKEGKSTVTVGADNNKVVSAMEDLVKDYNSAVSLLSKNKDNGSGNARHLQSLQSFVPGSKEGMDRMGLSFNKDGTLSLNKDKLSASLEKEPELTRNLIGGSSGIAQRAFSTSVSAAGASASSLIGNSLKNAENTRNSDPFNFMNSYGRSGAYNMTNFYVTGMLMNLRA